MPSGSLPYLPSDSVPRASYLDRGKREATRKMLNRGRIPFHPLVGAPHVPAMDAGSERCELSHQRRVGASDVLRVLLPERSGGYRLIQVLAGPDSFSHRFNQLTQIGQVTAQDCPRSQPEPPRVYRRLHSLRGWGHGETEPVFSGGAGASGAMVFEHTKQTAQGLSW